MVERYDWESKLIGFTVHGEEDLRDKNGKRKGELTRSELEETKIFYRPIIGGNTVYGLIAENGEVQMCVRFVDCVTTDRRQVVPEVIRNYYCLYDTLARLGVKTRSDEVMERAISLTG